MIIQKATTVSEQRRETARGMKLLVILSFGLLIAVAMAEPGNSEPQPTPIPSPGEMEESALPTSDAIPGEDEPSVLPKPDELPAHPRTEHPARASSERVSTRRSLGEQVIDAHEEAKAHEVAGSTGPSKSHSRRISSTPHSDPRNSPHVTKSLRSPSLRKSDHQVQSLRAKIN